MRPARIQRLAALLPDWAGVPLWRLAMAARFGLRELWRSVLIRLPASEWQYRQHSRLVGAWQRDLSELRSLEAQLDSQGPH